MFTPNSTEDTDEESSGLAQVVKMSSPARMGDTGGDLESTEESRTAALTGGGEGAGRRGRQSRASPRGGGNSEEQDAEGRSRTMWRRLSSGMKQNVDKIRRSDVKPSVLTHGLQHLRHFPCDDAPLHVAYGEGAGGFVSLHDGGRVRLYRADGRLRDPPPSSPVSVPYAGLTSTRLPGRLIGWGPGAALTLLDGDLRPLAEALDPPDVRVCQATEQSLELVTAGAGNVCVWCLTHMVCRVRVVEGLGRHSVFCQLALAPPGPERHHRAFAVSGRAVVVVDLTVGKVLEHKRSLHLRDITALAYCSHLDSVVTASKDVSIRVWGPDWGLRMAFVGHSGVVTSLVCCPGSGLLLSASLDGTLRCWSLEAGDQVQCVPVEGGGPPLALGGPCQGGGTFFSFSRQSVDFWTVCSLYTPHCMLGGDAPLRQILVPPSPPPYPSRVVCVSGAGDVTLVAAETGATLTSFRAGGQGGVRCADYCLHKEVLVVLTEAGVVISASTLTNPAAPLEEWAGRGQGPWRREEQPDGEGGVGPPSSGPGGASCLALYSSVADGPRALEEWRRLQERRGWKPRSEKPAHDAKNKFLVMLGHAGGCVSVLKLDSGKVQYRTPAHNGQRVTAMQAHPEDSYLLTAGEDKAVQVWRVFPYAQECLSLHLSLFCGHQPLHLALLGPVLALAFQEPHSATYSLVYFSLADQSRADHPPSEDHTDRFTGLCVCPQLRVFASSSRDGTVRIWDEENRLLRTLQLCAEPECLAFSRENGDLLLGIRGDLYRIHCAPLLPHDFQLRLLCMERSDPVPDPPVPRTPARASKRKTEAATREEHKEDKQEITRDPEYEALLTRNRDLYALQQGTAECRRKRPAATPSIRKEAFDRYMSIIYRTPLGIKIDEEDMFDLQATLFPPKLPECEPLAPPTLREGFFPSPSLATPLAKGALEEPDAERASAQTNAVGFIPNSVLVGQLWPDVVVEDTLPKTPFRLKDDLGHESEESDAEEVQFVVYEDDLQLEVCSPVILVETPPREPTPPPPPPVVEKVEYTLKPTKALPPIKRPKPLTPPPPAPKSPTPPPTRSPSPSFPEFLIQFMEEDWFDQMYPDRLRIRPSLGPEEFSLQMLSHMPACEAQPKLKILSAVLALRRQGALKDTDKLCKGLMGSLRNSTAPGMSGEEQRVVSEMLNVLVCLGPDSPDLIVELLTLLAHKELGLQRTVLCLLGVMGVQEADQWLGPEFDPWDSMLPGAPDPWEGLHQMASEWLEYWTSKYKVHNRDLFLKSAGHRSLFTPVDVLNYFCSVEKQRHKKATPPPPEGRKDTVLHLPWSDSSQPIQRLGETYSMSRIRRPPGLLLPPLASRPVLMGFSPFLALPLPRVSLFPFPADQPCLRATPRRYFILERSYVHYYR